MAETITESKHKTVLLHESIEGLNIGLNKAPDVSAPAIIVDATINGGGHSSRMIELCGSGVRIIGIDLDEDALSRATKRLNEANTIAERQGKGKAQFTLHCRSFRHLDEVLHDEGVASVDGILFDLGWSTDQVEQSGRGFTFQKDEPLLMSFRKNPDPEKAELTAYEIVNTWSEETLADIIFGYGEERYSRRIARAIVEARQAKPIATTFELIAVIRKGVPFLYTKGRNHFATKTFQALRIAVNDEVESLREGLRKAFQALKPRPSQQISGDDAKSGGRMAVISFHSIEDRIVKRFFQEQSRAGLAKIITPKPITASDEELAENRRSRSAKLRILEKIT